MKVLIFGATGMVGKGVLLECIDSPQIDSVVVIGRGSVGFEHPKMREVLHDDFLDFTAHADVFTEVDACFWCLGISSAGMPEAQYRKITQDYTLAAAHLLYEKSPHAKFCFVSGVGADETGKSKTMWARVKGNTETALQKVGFKVVVVFRPAFILPNRGVRSREFWYRVFYAFFSPFHGLFRFLGLASSTVEVGRAMIVVALGQVDKRLIKTRDINTLSKQAPYPLHRESRLKRIGRVWVWLIVLLILSGCFVLAGAWQAMGKRPDKSAVEYSPQWGEDTFVNPEPLFMDYGNMFRSMFSGSEYASPKDKIKTVSTNPDLFSLKPSSGLRVTWLGHSTLLIEIDGHTYLTDPVWGERSSPFTWLGPKRWYPPPLDLDKLPPLDAILISHDHYDHLDYPTIVELAEKIERFVVPVGVGSHLRYWGVPDAHIVELDWWDELSFGDTRVVCVPARHMSGRGVVGMKSTLWAGYAIVGSNHRAYFSGDTGMFPALSDIGRRLGPFDITMIEVGAYNSAWPDVHLGPEQAVQAHQMVRGKVMLPIHWGLFDLALHGWTEPIERTEVAAKLSEITLLTPQPGQSIEPSVASKQQRWWPDVPWETAEQHSVKSTLVE